MLLLSVNYSCVLHSRERFSDKVRRADVLMWMCNCEGPMRPRTIVYQAPDPNELQRARERRIKELKMYDILREIFFYVVYVWVIIVISYEFRDPNSFQLRENLRMAFVTGGHSTSVNSQTSLELVSLSVCQHCSRIVSYQLFTL